MRTYKSLICDNCQKPFVVEAKRKTQRFCSKGCATSFRQRIHDPDFMSIDKELRYYILGLIFTDGCITQQENKLEKIDLSNTDKGIMEKLHPIMSPERELYKKPPLKETHSWYYTIINTNKDSIKTLKKYGVEHAKTLNVKYPTNIPKKYAHHFIRGVFDGDGCIYENRVKQWVYKHISFTTASKDFRDGLIAHLEKFGFHPKYHEDSRGGKYYVNLFKKDEIKSFGKWIYKDSNYHIEYKKRLFVMI